MLFTLKDAADYFRTGKTVKAFLSLILSVKRIFTFKEERENRPARYVEILKAYEGGVPIEKILEKYGCSRATICRYVALAGMPKRHWKPRDEEMHDKILELSRKGLKQDQIARECKCSASLVRKVEKDAGIFRRKDKMTKKKAYAAVLGKDEIRP